MKLYKSYLFRGKDPVIDEIRTMVQDNYGRTIKDKHLKDIEINGGPSSTCMSNWFFGSTQRPQNATLEAAGRALGMKRVWVKNNDKK